MNPPEISAAGSNRARAGIGIGSSSLTSTPSGRSNANRLAFDHGQTPSREMLPGDSWAFGGSVGLKSGGAPRPIGRVGSRSGLCGFEPTVGLALDGPDDSRVEESMDWHRRTGPEARREESEDGSSSAMIKNRSHPGGPVHAGLLNSKLGEAPGPRVTRPGPAGPDPVGLPFRRLQHLRLRVQADQRRPGAGGQSLQSQDRLRWRPGLRLWRGRRHDRRLGYRRGARGDGGARPGDDYPSAGGRNGPHATRGDPEHPAGQPNERHGGHSGNASPSSTRSTPGGNNRSAYTTMVPKAGTASRRGSDVARALHSSPDSTSRSATVPNSIDLLDNIPPVDLPSEVTRKAVSPASTASPTSTINPVPTPASSAGSSPVATDNVTPTPAEKVSAVEGAASVLPSTIAVATHQAPGIRRFASVAPTVGGGSAPSTRGARMAQGERLPDVY